MKRLIGIVFYTAAFLWTVIFFGATLQSHNRLYKELHHVKIHQCWPVIEPGILEKIANYITMRPEEEIEDAIRCKVIK